VPTSTQFISFTCAPTSHDASYALTASKLKTSWTVMLLLCLPIHAWICSSYVREQKHRDFILFDSWHHCYTLPVAHDRRQHRAHNYSNLHWAQVHVGQFNHLQVRLGFIFPCVKKVLEVLPLWSQICVTSNKHVPCTAKFYLWLPAVVT
jgi:hypothetical protein